MRAAVLAAVFLAASASPRLARACFGIFDARAIPADGAVDVPLNAKVRLLFLRGGDAAFTVRLEDASGTRLPATVLLEPRGPMSQDPPFVATVVPEALLAPNTEHVVTLVADTWRWTFRFTTAADSDGVEPAAPAGLAIQHEFLAGTPDLNWCASMPQRHHFTVTAAPVEGAVAYRLYRDNLPVDFQDTPVGHLEVASSDAAVPWVCLALRAVDQAGNVSGFSVTLCAGEAPDAGVAEDGGLYPVFATRPPGGEEPPQRVSCQQASPWPWALLLVLGCRRKTRTRCAG